MRNTGKRIYLVILPLLAVGVLVVGGFVFVNREVEHTTVQTPKPLSIADRKASLEVRKRWEASADGIRYKAWEASPEGKKVHASHDKIKNSIAAFADMEAVVTSVTYQRPDSKSAGPKWLIVRINGEDYMMQFTPKEFQQLSSLQVNDKILVRSRSAGYSPNHPYLIVSGDYIEFDKKALFERNFSKNNAC